MTKFLFTVRQECRTSDYFEDQCSQMTGLLINVRQECRTSYFFVNTNARR